MLAWPASAADTGTDDTALDCGTPYSSDTGDDGQGGAGGHDHGAPENQPYDIDDFDLPENCAECHPTHYDQWQGSIHAYAATNPVMWVGSQRIGEVTEFPFNCVGCHAPAATLTASVPPEPLGSIDELPEAARSGVNCITCHKLYDVYNGVNQFTQCADYYFGTIPDPVEYGYHESDYSSIHTEALVCRSCHNVENLNFVQVEFTYSEWEEANYAAGGTETEPAIDTCQDCHMPSSVGQAAVDGPEREIHDHSFVGGDVALTPFADSHRQFEAVKAIMRQAATIESDPVYTGGLLGDIDVVVESLVPGHHIPTGTAFNRQFWLEVLVTDGEGKLLVESGTLDANGDLRDDHSELEPGSDFMLASGFSMFKSYLYDVNGEETFNFQDEAVLVDDQSLAYGEPRFVRFHLDPAPTSATVGPILVSVRLLYRPMPPFLLRELGIAESVIEAVPILVVDELSYELEGVTE